MRFSLWLALVPVSVFAASGNPVFPEPGTYRYDRRLEVTLAKRYETVYGFTEDGRRRLAELKSQGYICESRPRDLYQCAKSVPADDGFADLAERVELLLSAAELTFGPVRGPAEVLRKGGTTTEWSMPQSVDFRGRHYDSYRFLLTGDRQRLFLGSPAEASIVVADDGGLAYVLDQPIRRSQKVTYRYFGLAGFAR